MTWLLVGGVGVSCTSPRQSGNEERLARLEREARALARTEGCQTAGDCRTAPLGDMPCGGHRTYVVYCRRTTDSAALYRKLDELARAERAYTEQRGVGSICGVPAPPSLTVSAGSCRATAP